MNIILKNIPNLLTCLNLIIGLLSISFSFQGNLAFGTILIFSGLFIDFFDGFFARLLNAYSEFGKQLDSLADLVTFGIAPSIIIYQLINHKIFNEYILENLNKDFSVAYFAFIFPVFGAIRLAKFNLDTEQNENFIGLPIPAAGIFLASLSFYDEKILTTHILLLCLFTLSILLVSKISLFSLKIKRHEQKKSRLNYYRIILIISSLFLFYFFNFVSIPIIILIYITLSLTHNLTK
ncbi:MAG: CDP-diacylglycerol--serine O-phosphatidyltransferase [Flavobacteriales bacterium]|nr:CDP-diacylglycerol--serine O-phosphatidyltransferase [Flavobacteriales bacterium]|tara:strand:- start:328 stop:1035 length:708 start_codon:yes stop_codon:yes gene_type:complete